MWNWPAEELDDGAIRHRPEINGQRLVWREVLSLWQNEHDFRHAFNAVLADAPFAAFRWETPALDEAGLDEAFEFVVVDSPEIDTGPDSAPFADHFRQAHEQTVISFANLGGDARLVVPCPLADASAYTHIGRFVRHAPAEQQQQLWRTVGHAVARHVGARPLWLSTAGGGVAWLHVRLDDRPKYYRHAPYRDRRG